MLTKPLALMLSRGGQSLESGRIVAQAIGWSIIGEDPGDLIICDAGNALVGFGFKVESDHAASALCCSERFTEPVPIGANPGSEMVLVPDDFEAAIPKAAALQRDAAAVTAELVHKATGGNPQLSVFDINGNLTTFTRPTERSLTGKLGTKVRTGLTANGLEGTRSGQSRTSAALIGISYVVADLQQSTQFYRDVLGLSVLRKAERKVSFDAGPIVLRVQREWEGGLIRSHSVRGLLTDQLSFYVPDIIAEVKNLTDRGVRFPNGIEGSASSGHVAFFQDPDGYNLWLWQPPKELGPGMPINYFPLLDRILSEQGVTRG